MVDIELKLPDNWFESEIRNGYEVTTKQKEIWAIELDMLYKFMNICNKHNLKWWVDGGTLLGAVRHKGFIPWDDDIDVFMLREDYNKFIDIAKTEITGNYYLQTDEDGETFYAHAKMRRTDTTAILAKDIPAKFKFNQGIFIDIFPFDNVSDDENEYNYLISRLSSLKRGILIQRSYWWTGNKNPDIFRNCINLQNMYHKLRTTYNTDETEFIANLGLPSIKHDVRKKRTEITDTIYMQFEMLTVPVPVGYDSILKRLYGDYMEPVKGISKHGQIIFSTNHSYKDFPFNEVMIEFDKLLDLEYSQYKQYEQYCEQYQQYEQNYPSTLDEYRQRYGWDTTGMGFDDGYDQYYQNEDNKTEYIYESSWWDKFLILIANFLRKLFN